MCFLDHFGFSSFTLPQKSKERNEKMAISILKTLTHEHFEQMMDLEKQYYSEEYITPAEEAFRWYQHYPFTIVAAGNEKEIAGFVNLFPVTEEVFESLKAGKFNDHNLTFKDIVDFHVHSPQSINMFLSCIVVKEEYRKQGLPLRLLQAAILPYKEVLDRCQWIITDNVTKKGEAFSEKYGLSFHCHSNHGSKIYLGKFRDFVNAVLK